MADIITTPRVVDDNSCLLYGRLFKLAGPVQTVRASEFPGKIVFGDFTRASHPYASYMSFQNTVGGAGIYEFTTPDNQSDRFWTSTCLTWKNNYITLAPLATSIANPTGETGAVTSIVHGHNDNIYVSFGANI